jgi:hypothetical protein
LKVAGARRDSSASTANRCRECGLVLCFFVVSAGLSQRRQLSQGIARSLYVW